MYTQKISRFYLFAKSCWDSYYVANVSKTDLSIKIIIDFIFWNSINRDRKIKSNYNIYNTLWYD